MGRRKRGYDAIDSAMFELAAMEAQRYVREKRFMNFIGYVLLVQAEEVLKAVERDWVHSYDGGAFEDGEMPTMDRVRWLLSKLRDAHPNITLPANTATADLVMRFAGAMAEKLAAAEAKYGYSDGWLAPDWMDECRAKLVEHVAKGDPRDVAAYCAFLWHHGELTALTSTTPPAERVSPEAVRYEFRCSTPTWNEGKWQEWTRCDTEAEAREFVAYHHRRGEQAEYRALGVIEPVAETEERCESGDPECGPVTHHDSEGVPLCDECWADLCADAENAGLIEPAAPQEDRGHG